MLSPSILLNKLVGYITYQPRVDEELLLLLSLIQIAIVQAWALYGDNIYDTREVEQQGFDLRKFAEELADELLNEQ